MRRGFIYLLYWTLQAAGLPFLLLYLAVRIARNRQYARGLAERFGLLPASIPTTLTGGIWLHAVSVGEILSSVTLLKQLRAAEPEAPLFVSTTTLAGRAMAESKLKGLVDGVFYTPLDYRFAVRSVLRRLRPALVIVMETEIWPNLYRDARRAGARLLVVNGRISDKAWPRYRPWRWFFAAALSWVDEVQAQGPQAAERYRLLGAPRVVEAGNLKYDFDPEATSIAVPVQDWLDHSGTDPVWIAASTMPGEPDEDQAVIDAYRALTGVRLILVPRKPERFDEAARKLEAAGIPYVRRSQLPCAAAPPVLLLDSMGELAGLFRAARAVFMGGTLVERGGHNILEPAAFGCPVIVGPHMENFPEIAAEFAAAGAWLQIPGASALAGAVRAALADTTIGPHGRLLAGRNRGATARAVARAQDLLPRALPRPLWPWWRLATLGPLTLLWRAGVALDRARTPRRRLARPVISVGNLTAGGTGKTPFTLWLAQALQARGWRVCVLSRGYRSGEETRLYDRAGIAVAVGRDRFAAAQGVETDVFLLDDGMQHWALHRDVEILLVDGLDPTGGGLLPLGRAREPWSARVRAHATVATRRPLEGAAYAAAAIDPVSVDAAAFCGLGNPASFHRSLRAAGVRLAFFRVFPDHHVYAPSEIEAMLAECPTLLTTEKDWLNLPPLLQPRVQAVPMRLEIANPGALLDQVEARLRAAAASV